MTDASHLAEDQMQTPPSADLKLTADPIPNEHSNPIWIIFPLIAQDSSFREELARACEEIGRPDWAQRVTYRQLPALNRQENEQFVLLAEKIRDQRGIPPAPIDENGQLDPEALTRALRTPQGLMAFFAGLCRE